MGKWFTTIFGIWFAPFRSSEKSIELSSFSLVKQPSMYVCLAFIRQSNQANFRETHHSCSCPHFVCLSNLRRRKFCCSFMNLGSKHTQTQIHRWKLSNFLWEPERESVCERELTRHFSEINKLQYIRRLGGEQIYLSEPPPEKNRKIKLPEMLRKVGKIITTTECQFIIGQLRKWGSWCHPKWIEMLRLVSHRIELIQLDASCKFCWAK